MLKRKIMPALAVVLTGLMITIAAASPSLNKIDNFSLTDYNGKKHSLYDYKNSKAIVLIFISTECPVSNAYNTRMADLYNQYSSKDITIIGINSNRAESVEDIKEHAAEHNFGFPILKDEGNKIADKLGAAVTPETYLLNNNFEILYHGRIDDSRDIKSVSEKDLANALDEVLSGKKVSKTDTKAFGCSIKRVKS